MIYLSFKVTRVINLAFDEFMSFFFIDMHDLHVFRVYKFCDIRKTPRKIAHAPKQRPEIVSKVLRKMLLRHGRK